MRNDVLFTDVGWCVARIAPDETVFEAGAIYASHTTCSRSRLNKTKTHEDDGERWSWFIDDIESRGGGHVCFECGNPVPEHIQALVVLHTPLEEIP